MEKDKSNIVHEWRIKLTTPAEQYLEDYTTCVLCGTELLFTHVTQFVYGQVEEEAECPHCKIQLKKQTHKLQ